MEVELNSTVNIQRQFIAVLLQKNENSPDRHVGDQNVAMKEQHFPVGSFLVRVCTRSPPGANSHQKAAAGPGVTVKPLIDHKTQK